jgi:two-component system sensor kinase FixL
VVDTVTPSLRRDPGSASALAGPIGAAPLTDAAGPRFYMAMVLFVVCHVALDWFSYIDPLYGLNITPWNPDPALGLVLWLTYGRRVALPWFVALVAAEWLVRGMPGGLTATLLLSAWLTLAYGVVAEMLRRRFSDTRLVNKRRRLGVWMGIAIPGLTANALIYLTLLVAAGLLPAAALPAAAFRFAVGDIVGMVVSMPLLWMLAVPELRSGLLGILWRRETAAYVCLCGLMVWGVFFGPLGVGQFRHFYLLFLPVIWAATRHGMPGTALITFLLQIGIICAARWSTIVDVPFTELQLLGAAFALVGLFIAISVDDQRQAADELRQSLRLAAAGEMAGALAHELNQPVTALAAYGKACEHLLERGGNEALLQDTMRKMVHEAGRAADVVRRLREFFRTGAMHFESIPAAGVVQAVVRQFEDRCRHGGIRLEVAPVPAVLLRADRLQIELVLRNLIANAIDSVSASAQTDRSVAVICTALEGARLAVSVEDNGAGISAAMAARLFEPFVSSKSSGLGLGLVLSRAIVEAHGGTLWTEPGRRGVFRFVLPLAESAEPAGAPP